MKKLSIILGFFCFIGLNSFVTFAQIGINSTGTAPAANAMLDVSSTTKGALLPRMTTAQRTALTISDGLTVYDTDTKSYWFVKGNIWTEMVGGSSGGGPWTVSGANIYNNNTVNVGIGTSTPTSKLNVNGQITIDQKNFGDYGGLLIKGNVPGSNYPNIGFTLKNSSNTDVVGAMMQGELVNNNSGNESIGLGFYTSSNGLVGLGQRMYIHSNGHVGIGTNNPAVPLDIKRNTTGAAHLRLSGINESYMEFHPNNSTPNTRYGWLGFSQPNIDKLWLFNERSGGITLFNNGGSSLDLSPTHQVVVDPNNVNNGNVTGDGIVFGGEASGEGIASKRTTGGNQHGLDFYTQSSPRLSISNNGNVGIGENNPGFLLNFPSTLGDKISLYGNTGAHYGMGIQGGTFQIHAGQPSDDIAFGTGSSTAFTEKFRFNGEGSFAVNGNTGTAGQVLTSNGAGAAATWVKPMQHEGAVLGYSPIVVNSLATFTMPGTRTITVPFGQSGNIYISCNFSHSQNGCSALNCFPEAYFSLYVDGVFIANIVLNLETAGFHVPAQTVSIANVPAFVTSGTHTIEFKVAKYAFLNVNDFVVYMKSTSAIFFPN